MKIHRSIVVLPCLFLAMFDGVLSQAMDCANPADIVFLLDGSDSIDMIEWDQSRNFVSRMINDLDIGPGTIHAGIMVYSSTVSGTIGLSPYKPKMVLSAMARTLNHPTGISTNTAAGISKIRDTFRKQPASRAGAPKIAIVVTDGSSENPAETIRQAQLAKSEGIRMIAVGVGNNVFVEELQQIATNRRKFYPVADFNALRGIEADLRAMICRVIVTTTVSPIAFKPPTLPPGLIPLTGDKICNVPADIVFVIDGSDSITDEDFIRLKNFVANLIDNFEIGPTAIHVGMIVYSTLIGNAYGLQPAKSKNVLKFMAMNLQHPKFGTDTALGIEEARKMITQQGRPHAPEIIVVITDGRSTNPRNTIIQASIAKANAITMISIGVGHDIFSEELGQIASNPNLVSEVADFRSLENTVNTMRNLICTSITTPAPTTTPQTAPTTMPYIPPPPEGLICNVPADVVFLLDGSDSISDQQWVIERNFVGNLINNLEIGLEYIHAAIVVYSSSIGDQISLTPYKTKRELNNRLKSIKQPVMGTDTALGIQKAREILKNEGRANAPKIVIVVTDGKSTYPDNTKIQAMMAQADGITMIAVGIGLAADIYQDELDTIATSHHKVFKVSDFMALQGIIGQLRDLICRAAQTTTVAPPSTPMTTPALVTLYPCVESRRPADMIFLIDGTNNMGKYDWMMETHFVSNFLDGLEIQEHHVHVGMVISDHVRGDTIGITPFKTRYHLKELIHGLLPPSGAMDTAKGIAKVRDIFATQGRRDAFKFVILVTDGRSNSMTKTLQEAARLKQQGATVITVGVGPKINMAELTAVATNPRLFIRAADYESFFQLLPGLQNLICALLGQSTTTTVAPITTPIPVPELCDGCLIDNGVGFNPFPGDCTKYVQCWTEGLEVKYLVRSCPFGQYWDADVITCRPSFLVNCTGDPCKGAVEGFSYGLLEHGCRAYWKCLGDYSVAHCCPRGSAYVEGMGCLQGKTCNEACPPDGGIAARPTCDKKAHWDERYYIQIIVGRGEVVRPCPAGTVYVPEQCSCDFGMSGLVSTPQSYLCNPSAHFNFDYDLKDQSLNQINTGVTNVQRTDLGTAYFNGRSEMNMWRFAGADWGNTLVIKFKFRFDHNNKFIDYGGLPVDLGYDFDVNRNLVSNYRMQDNDWRLWTKLRNVQTLQDWRQLLKEFGRSRTFYIFMGTLGFAPGTSDSRQVISILGSPEAFAEFQRLFQSLRLSRGESVGAADLQDILARLRGMRGLINWSSITGHLQGDTTQGTSGTSQHGGASDKTTPIDVIGGHGGHGSTSQTGGSTAGQTSGTIQWKINPTTGQWQKVFETGTKNANMTFVKDGEVIGSQTDWTWNSQTGKWDRKASVSTMGGVESLLRSSGGWQAGFKKHSAGQAATVHQSAAQAGIQTAGQAAAGTQSSGQTGSQSTTSGNDLNMAQWQQLYQKMQQLLSQNATQGWKWDQAVTAESKAAIENLLKQLQQGASGGSQWQWSTSGQLGGTATGNNLDVTQMAAILNQLQNLSGRGWENALANSQGSAASATASGNTATSFNGGMGSNVFGDSMRTIQTRVDNSVAQPDWTVPASPISVTGGRVVGGAITGTVTIDKTGSSGGAFATDNNAQTGGQAMVSGQVTVNAEGQSADVTNRQRRRPFQSGGASFSVVKQTVEGKSSPGGVRREHIAPRGAEAGGFNMQLVDGQIVGLGLPRGGDILSGATVIGKEVPKVKVTHTEPRVRVNQIVQEVHPVSFEMTGQDGGASGSGQFGQRGGSASVTLTQSAGVQGAGQTAGSSSRSGISGGQNVHVITGSSGMQGGDFTQLGKVTGSGGGVKRIVDTNIKRVPAGMVHIGKDGAVDLASLGLGGAEGANIIRHTVQVGQGSGSGAASGVATGNDFLSGGQWGMQSGGGGADFSTGGNALGGGQWGMPGGGGGDFSTGGNALGGGGGQWAIGGAGTSGSGATGNTGFTASGSNTGSRAGFIPFINQETAENFMDSLLGKRRRRRSIRRPKRAVNKRGVNKSAVNKRAYQALVTNCQGQEGQGPSIMMVANQNDVQLALKTDRFATPGIVSVPVVDGWNDVTLIYDGTTLTGVVENWKGFYKSAVNLSGNIERRQAGLLVGSCQGYASFHGEMDDLTAYDCITPEIKALRDKIRV